MLALTGKDVQDLVPMKTAVELMKVVFADLSAGTVTSPLRTQVPVPEANGVSLFMPAYVPSIEGLGMKVVSVFPGNLELGKPTINAIVAVLDAKTGEPAALMDGTFLTALRTGAGAGAATDLLARPDSKIVTCIGAGAQGLTQAWAVSATRDLEKVYVFDINEQTRNLNKIGPLFLERKRAQLEGLGGRLAAVNPFAVLQRGYSIATNARGEIIASCSQVHPGDTLVTRVHDGRLISTVGETLPADTPPTETNNP